MNKIETFIQQNNLNLETFYNALYTDILQYIFKHICIMLNTDKELYLKLKRLYFSSNNEETIVKQFITNKFNLVLSEDDIKTINTWLVAYFNKSSIRVEISKNTKENLLQNQHNRCAICHKPLNGIIHIDHILPFSFVGDELENNYQALCETCNLKKSNNVSNNVINYIMNGDFI